MATMHGGTLTAHSEGKDQGSRFELTLPLLPADDDEGHLRGGGQQGTPRGQGLTVLVVDDNEDAAHMLSDLLRGWGFATLVAHDGPTALSLLADRQVDLGLLDIGLPVMDGYELAQAIHRLPHQAYTPLIALSGYGQDKDRQRSRDSGFREHLIKPVDVARLACMLETLGQPVN